MKPDTDGRASPPEATFPSLVVGREACVDYGRSSELEWLEANGTGGFAMGTVAGSNTRRYHGLLVASLHPPVERVVTLSRLEESVLGQDGEAPLCTNQYPGTLYPEGFQSLKEFRLYPCPTWTFQVGQLRLERRLFLVPQRQMVVVLYRASEAVRLRLSPLLAFRDYHALEHRAEGSEVSAHEESAGAVRRLTFQPRSGFPPLFLHHPGLAFESAPEWHENVEYLRELDRGLDFREDLFLPGSFLLDVGPKTPGWAVATLEADARIEASTVQALERDRTGRREFGEPVQARLRAAAEQFLVTRADGSPTVLAGYPWFTDWGRDTMISIPGLLLSTGKLGVARRVLEGFLGHLDGGLVPNRFPDQSGPAEYNTVDATLWMFQAVHAFLAAGGGRDFLEDVFYPAAREVVEAHLRGTHNGIRADAADGLLVAGGPGTNLTWMDARVDGQPVTPRHGKPVEVNALWYNALRLMERWANELADGPGRARYGALAGRAGASFERLFWNPARDCLYDVILPEGPDGRLRPNQLLALSLAFPLLGEGQRHAVLHRVESELLTPVGLRTLARGEPGYAPSYRGGPAERDAAYHQGLVWPWLLGPFVDAYLLVHGSSNETRRHCRGLLRGLEAPFGTGCLGSLSECFEAEAPFRAVAAPAQAWSVAELLRVRTVLAQGAASQEKQGTSLGPGLG
jgi:predicted glycogen debranching enzyme